MHTGENLQPPTAGELKGLAALMIMANIFVVIFGCYIPLSVGVSLGSEISGSGLSTAEILKHLVGAAGCVLFGIILPVLFGWISIECVSKAYRRH